MALSLVACQNDNPFLTEQHTPYGVPAFDKVKVEHYKPAFKEAIAQQEAEIKAIINNPQEPTFENTIVALDRSGALLEKVEGVFFNILDADGNAQMDSIANVVSPILSALNDSIMLNDKLFSRIKAVYDARESLELDTEQMRLLTETY